MNERARLLFVMLVTFVFGCSLIACSDSAPQQRVGRSSSALTTPRELSLALPVGARLHDLAISTKESLRIGSQATVVNPSGGFGTIANSGEGDTEIGVEARVGSLTSEGTATIGNRAVVSGDLKTAQQSVTLRAGAVVTGSTQVSAALTPVQQFAWTVNFASGGVDVTVGASGDRMLAPGAYRNVFVDGNGTLRISAGEYHLSALRTAPGSRVVADTSQGPVFVYVESVLDTKTAIDASGAENNVFVAFLGTGIVSIAPPFAGTVVAPSATLKLGSGAYRGSFFAANIDVAPRATVTTDAFAAWDFLFPPVPHVDCVIHFDATHSNAQWGYENPLDVAVTIPVGSRNILSPSDARVVTTFEPGRHDRVFMSFFATPQATWQIGTAPAAIADANLSRRCPAAELPLVGGIDELPRSESASPPQLSLLSTVQPRTVGVISGILPASTPPAPPAPGVFRFIVDGQHLSGSDAVCGPRQLAVNVIMNGVGSVRDLPGCTNPDACGVPVPHEVYEAPINAGQTTMDIHVDIYERDTGGCGDDDDHILTADLKASADTGKIGGGQLTTFHSDGSVDKTLFLDAGVSSIQGLDGFGIFFSTEVAPPPKICGAWKGRYVDSGPGTGPGFDAVESFFATREAEEVPASFSRFELLIKSAGETRFERRGVLDRDGCVPRANTPGASLLAAATNPVIVLRLQSESCWDPAEGSNPGGGDCTEPASQPRGGRIRVVASESLSRVNPVFGQPKPVLATKLSCAALTRDAGAQEPNCDLQRDLPGWDASGRPPSTIRVVNSSVDDVTNSMALVSHMLRLEDSGADLGLRSALITRRGSAVGGTHGLIEIALNTVACFSDPGPGIAACSDTANSTELLACLQRGACDTAASDPIAIAPSRPNGAGGTIPGDANWKYVFAHEFGHKVQERATGILGTRYTGVGSDPGIAVPEKCTCAHVSTSNVLHCLQSIEEPNAAHVEGWAQFFASRVFNDAARTDCVFKYYKEFLSDGRMPGVAETECTTTPAGTVCRPPIPVNCVTPVRWRNNMCLDSTVSADQGVTQFGTEYDFMGFFYGLNTQAPDRYSFEDLYGIFRTACTGGVCQRGNGSNNTPLPARVAWDNCSGVSCRSSAGLVGSAEQLFGLGSTKALRFANTGDTYGVSRSVSR